MVNYKQCESLFTENGLEYSEEIHEKLSAYCDFLIEYNQKVNLTAITDPEEIKEVEDRARVFLHDVFAP